MITSSPSLNQVMVGVGSPSALHPKVTGSFLATAVSSGCSMIFGGDEEEAKIPEKKEDFYFILCETTRILQHKFYFERQSFFKELSHLL